MKFTYNKTDGSITINQRAYIENVLKWSSSRLQGYLKPTPLTPHVHLSKSDCPEVPDKKVVKLYQQLIGSLMYIACAHTKQAHIHHEVQNWERVYHALHVMYG